MLFPVCTPFGMPLPAWSVALGPSDLPQDAEGYTPEFLRRNKGRNARPLRAFSIPELSDRSALTLARLCSHQSRPLPHHHCDQCLRRSCREPPGTGVYSCSPTRYQFAHRVVRQHTRGCPGQPRRGAGPHSRSHRLFDHRRCRPQGRALCLLLDRSDHRNRRRQAGHDLGRDGGNGRSDGHARQGSRTSISARRDRACRRPADHRGLSEARLRDALRLAIRHDRLRQRARHPDLPGPVARTDRRALDDLRAGRGRSRHHLSASAADQGGAVAADLHHRADGALPGASASTSAQSATWASCRRRFRYSSFPIFR